MYSILLHLHSVLRYAVLILLLAAIFRSFTGWLNKKPYTPADRKISLFTMIFTHLQFIIGLWLYLISPYVHAGLANMGNAMKDKALRFWTVEHISIMLIAIVLITLGNSMAKRAPLDVTKHKKTALFFLIALILILVSIPWPFSTISRDWM